MKICDITLLREMINCGWTKAVRTQFVKKLGQEQMNTLGTAYSFFAMSGFPIKIKGSISGEDIFVKTALDAEKFFQFSDINMEAVTECIPKDLNGKFNSWLMTFIEPITKKLEMTFNTKELMNIEKTFEKLSQTEIDDMCIPNLTYAEIRSALGIIDKKESYKISDLIRHKKVGNSASMVGDKTYVSREITKKSTKKKFFERIGDLFGIKSSEINYNNLINDKNLKNFEIIHNGKPIAYYTIEIKNGALGIHNFAVEPEYKISKMFLKAILEIRDNITNIAKKMGIKTIYANTDINKPELAGMYKRFGFQENGAEYTEYVNDFGETVRNGMYHLIRHLN